MIPTDAVAQEILRTIRQVIRGISIHSKQLLREVGLTVPQMVCLRAIHDIEHAQGGVTVIEISQRVHLSAATVSRIVDRLTATGLLIRERSVTDRRKVSISLTAAGRKRVQTSPSPLQENFVRGLAALPLEERVALLTALKKIVVLMNAEDLDAAPLLAPGSDFKG